MTSYYVREEHTPWISIAARTIEGAKRAAARRQAFRGTRMQIAVCCVDGHYEVVASKRSKRWHEHEHEHEHGGAQ